MRKEQERAKLIAKRYPILEAVEPEKRRDYVRKAVMHPIIITFALLLAGLILPKGLEVAMNQLGLAGGIVDIETALKFCLMVGIPFFFIYTFLNKLLMPFCIKRILKKDGYFDSEE